MKFNYRGNFLEFWQFFLATFWHSKEQLSGFYEHNRDRPTVKVVKVTITLVCLSIKYSLSHAKVGLI